MGYGLASGGTVPVFLISAMQIFIASPNATPMAPPHQDGEQTPWHNPQFIDVLGPYIEQTQAHNANDHEAL